MNTKKTGSGEEGYKLRLQSKRLHSGRFQVKFFVSDYSQRPLYGYLLADPKSTLKEVVERIRHGLTGESPTGYKKLGGWEFYNQRSNKDNQLLIFTH